MHVKDEDQMQEYYKSTTIIITALPTVRNLRWESRCKIKFIKDAQELIEYLKLDLDYDTAEQAEQAGLVFSKKWVDAGKPTPRTSAK